MPYKVNIKIYSLFTPRERATSPKQTTNQTNSNTSWYQAAIATIIVAAIVTIAIALIPHAQTYKKTTGKTAYALLLF